MFGFRHFLVFLSLLSAFTPVLSAPVDNIEDAFTTIEERGFSGKTDYTIDQIVQQFQARRGPANGRAVFYHGSFRLQALQFAFREVFTTLYDVYTRSGVNAFSHTQDPQASYDNADLRRRWYQDTSEAYATRATGRVYFVWDGVTPLRLPAGNGRDAWTSIWLTHELPRLVQQGNEIIQVNPDDFDDQQPYNGPGPAPPQKREVPVDARYDLQAAKEAEFAKRQAANDSALDWIVPRYGEILKRDSEPIPGGKISESCFIEPGCYDYIKNSYANFPNVEGSVFTWDNDANQYVPDYCGFHVVQYAQGFFTGPQFNITMFDSDQLQIGQTPGLLTIRPGQVGQLNSHLPYGLLITSGGTDNAPLGFAYGDQFWSSSSPQCSVGKYDSGKRQMDCGFRC